MHLKLTEQQLKTTLYAMSYLLGIPNYKLTTDKHTQNRKSNPNANSHQIIREQKKKRGEKKKDLPKQTQNNLKNGNRNIVVVQSLSHVRLSVTPWTAAHEASLSSTVSQGLPKFMSTELVIPSNHLILCCPLLLLSIFPSIMDFSNESALCIRWSKYWSFSHSPSYKYSVSISFRIDWFDLAVQRTLRSLFQHHNSKASVFQLLTFLWSNCHIHK